MAAAAAHTDGDASTEVEHKVVDSCVLPYVKQQTPNLCLANAQNVGALRYVKDPEVEHKVKAERTSSDATTLVVDYDTEVKVKPESEAEVGSKRHVEKDEDEEADDPEAPAKRVKSEPADDAEDEDDCDCSRCEDQADENSSTGPDEEEDDDDPTEEEDDDETKEVDDPKTLVSTHFAPDLCNSPFTGDASDEAHTKNILKNGSCPPLPVAEKPTQQLRYIDALIWKAYTLQLTQIAVPDRVHPEVIRALKDAGFTLFRATYTERDGQMKSELNIAFLDQPKPQDVMNYHRAKWWRQCVEDFTLAYHVLASEV